MARKDGETASEIPLTGRGGRPSVWHLSGIAYAPSLPPPPLYLTLPFPSVPLPSCLSSSAASLPGLGP
jgi:hypothetical protein